MYANVAYLGRGLDGLMGTLAGCWTAAAAIVVHSGLARGDIERKRSDDAGDTIDPVERTQGNVYIRTHIRHRARAPPRYLGRRAMTEFGYVPVYCSTCWIDPSSTP